MKMVIATGGTGGHIYPAIALADAAKKRYADFDVLFVGNDDRMETTEVPSHGYRFYGIHASGLTGNVVNKLKALKNLVVCYHQAKIILKKEQPDIVIGFGGYVSAPVILAAHALGIQTMIHEQNSMVGAANHLLAKRVDKIVVCYEKAMDEMPKNKTRLLGNPRASLARLMPFNETYFTSLNLSLDKKTILIVMGSLGSSSMNKIMVEACKKIPSEYQVLYVCGKNNKADLKNQFNENIVVVDYVNQLEILSHIDLIICRAGATTLAEITSLGIAAILIPSPYVAHNHQFFNASVLKNHHAALLVEEKDCNAEQLEKSIHEIMDDECKLETMKAASKELGFPSAASDILDWIDEKVKKNER
ncbi:MAG: undecaprenyldiphospho-muramoylpentapeptide beta-N-acetylglucosaminyltransferase [Erysipelotrichaceae bacterium]